MITLEFVHTFVYENLSKVTVSKSGTHFHTRCPLCGDSKKSQIKKRFHIDYNNSQPFFHCFNCEESGSFLELYSKIKCISIADAKKQLFKYDPGYLIQQLSPKKKEKIIEEIQYESHNYILKDCVGVHSATLGFVESKYKQLLMKFINDRKIPLENPIFIAYKGEYKNRIIIPIYENGDIVYFQGRALDDVPYDKKYKNPTLQKGTIILNKDKFDRSKYIIATEGLIDAFMVKNQGTSCLGAYVNEWFINCLLSLTDKGVILALDNDEPGRTSIKKILKEEKWSHKVLYFFMPKKYKNVKDLNELCINTDVEDVYTFVVENIYDKFNAQVIIDSGG